MIMLHKNRNIALKTLRHAHAVNVVPLKAAYFEGRLILLNQNYFAVVWEIFSFDNKLREVRLIKSFNLI